MKCPRFRCLYFSVFLGFLIIVSGIVAVLIVKPPTKGCVASSTKLCTEIAGQMIEKGGTVADAAIAGLLCEGVSLPGSCGLGGGFVLIMYAKGIGQYILNAMPKAPENVITTMFDQYGLPTNELWSTCKTAPGKSPIGSMKKFTKPYSKRAVFGSELPSTSTHEFIPKEEQDSLASEIILDSLPVLEGNGPKSILIPGELMGYMELYKRFGKLQWEELFLPAIELCEHGVIVNDYYEILLKKNKNIIYNNPDLKKIFYDEEVNSTLVAGQIFKMPELANTLRIISKEGANALYDGSLTQMFIDDIPGSLIERSDMRNYRPKWQLPVKSKIGDNQLFTAPIPASGHMLTFFFNVLNGTITNDGYSYSNWNMIIEAFKYMFAKGSKLEDSPEGQQSAEIIISKGVAQATKEKIIKAEVTHQSPEFYLTEYQSFWRPPGKLHTSHLCILAPNGFAISVTNSLNTAFGAGVMSRRTGIILNNDMSNFSNGTFPNEYGFYLKHKNRLDKGLQPMNPLCPAVLINGDGSVRLIIGGTGGPRIVTAVGLTILKHVFFDVDIQTALSEYRLHHQLIPMNLFLEDLFKNDVKSVKNFKRVGHNVSFYKPEGLETVTAIANNTYEDITGVSDLRRGPNRVYYIY